MVRNLNRARSRRFVAALLQRLPLACSALLAISVLMTGGAYAQNINDAIQGPWQLRCDFTQTVTASSAYTSGNAVGGLITCSSSARVAGHGGIAQGGVLRDKSGNAVSYDLILLDQNPSATTVTDKSAVAINTADLAKVIGRISFSTVTLGAASTMGFFTASGVGLPYKLTSGTTVYGILVTRGTPTFASTSDVTGSIVFLPD